MEQKAMRLFQCKKLSFGDILQNILNKHTDKYNRGYWRENAYDNFGK